MAPAGELDFDHVALATNDATPVLELLVGRLRGDRSLRCGRGGFRWALLHAGDAAGGC